MIATLPTGWRGQSLALSLAFITLAAVYALAVVPLLDLYAERAETVEAQRLLRVKLNTIAGEMPALRARVAELGAAIDSNKRTLEGASDPIASAALQGHLEELASGAGVTIGSTESLPTETRGAYHRIGLRLVLSGSYESLMKLLAMLETATPPLVVDNLQIHGLQRRPGTAPLSVLDMNLEVYGFRADVPSDTAKR